MKQSSVIARTEIMRVSNSVSQAIYEANKDIIKGLEFCATLDDRTCLLPGTLIYTKRDGWKTIEKILIGDQVLTHKGDYKIVTNKMVRNKKRYLKIKLSNGKEISITPDHKVLVNGEWIEIGNLKEGDFIDGLSI